MSSTEDDITAIKLDPVPLQLHENTWKDYGVGRESFGESLFGSSASENTNQNANTEDSTDAEQDTAEDEDSDVVKPSGKPVKRKYSGVSTPRVRFKRRKKELTDDEKKARERKYRLEDYSGTTIHFPKIPDDHELKDVLERLRETNMTIVHATTQNTRRPVPGKTRYVPAAVVAQMILNGTCAVTLKGEGENSKVDFKAKGFREIDVAKEQLLKSGEQEDETETVFKHYLYLPMNHTLPECEIDESVSYGKWRAFVAVLPNANNWRTFKYSYSNIRYNGTTYSANCRHPVSAWDEHPWCVLCLLQAGIKMCEDSDEFCYICEVMGPHAKAARKSKIKYWKNKYDKSHDHRWSRSNLLNVISTQLHADYANVDYRDPPNPDWEYGYFGFCRPGWHVPIFASWREYYDACDAGKILTADILQHYRHFNTLYDEIRNSRRKSAVYPKLHVSTLTEDSQQSTSLSEVFEGRNLKTPDDLKREKKTTRRRKVQKNKKDKEVVHVSDTEEADDKPDEEEEKEEDESDKPKCNYCGQLNYMSALKTVVPKWQYHGTPVTRMGTDNQYMRSQRNALIAAAGLLGSEVKFKDTKKADDAMLDDIDSEGEIVFEATDRLHNYVNETLERYERDAWDPALPTSLPICLKDFPVRDERIQTEPKLTAPDTSNMEAYDYDAVMMSQREITGIDSVNRAMVRIHESDAYLMPALINYINEMRDPKNKAQAPPHLKELTKVVNALRQNLVTRERLIGLGTGMVVAIRRRDNAVHQELDGGDVSKAVSRKMDDRTGATLL